MKWEPRLDADWCVLSSNLEATVYGDGENWAACVVNFDGHVVADLDDHATESAAKSAVAAWIGKTIAQLGNALAAGEPRVDEE